jgi:predicted AlkP superfamily phosphohydrolase/phosphomutase
MTRLGQTIVVILAVAGGGLTGCGRTAVNASAPRIIVLGIDGMDPNFLDRHWDSLPNLDALRREGEFKHLETTMPPQSPVAWSTFITGLDPGGHGIFDFVHRDPKTMTPYSSMSQATQGRRSIPVGAYELPISSGEVVSFRKGKPFWQILAEHHVATTIIRMPTDFPPVHCDDGVSVAGMGTPDLRGTFGTFTFYTDNASQKSRPVAGGDIQHVTLTNHSTMLRLQGPDNSLRKDKRPAFVEFAVHVDPQEPVARFDFGETQIILKQGEWSSWVQVKFPLIPGMASAAGMVRLYAKKLHPDFELYVSPINIDPSDPELPITSPPSAGPQLAKEVGLFYTQGMAQDTAAYRQGVFNKDEYVAQSREVSSEHLRLLRHALNNFHSGLLFFHFFGVDQDSHMLWGKYEADLLNTYRMADQAIGWVRKQAPDATLIVMSDHGFSTFERAVHLNSWLMQRGFLTLDDPQNVGPDELFQHVDWSRTVAYSIGLNGVYLNLKGREREGIVSPGEEADALLKKIADELRAARDPQTGKPMVGGVTFPHLEFHGEMRDAAPDLIVGYQPGYRSSWETALGVVPAAIVENNTDAWRADHCIDAQFVPGVLISNRRSQAADPHLYDLTVSLLQQFGIAPAPGMIGHSIY